MKLQVNLRGNRASRIYDDVEFSTHDDELVITRNGKVIETMRSTWKSLLWENAQ